MDESIHGVYIGMLAQELYQQLSPEEQVEVDNESIELLLDLYKNELTFTKEIYEPIGLTDEVAAYIRYNANRALMNLGKDAYFPEEPINPIVENGLKTDTKNHDFFSVNILAA